jgi:hypothetical protein
MSRHPTRWVLTRYPDQTIMAAERVVRLYGKVRILLYIGQAGSCERFRYYGTATMIRDGDCREHLSLPITSTGIHPRRVMLAMDRKIARWFAEAANATHRKHIADPHEKW